MQNFHKYLPTGETEEAWGFYVTTVGFSKTAPHHAYPRAAEHPKDHSLSWNKGRILNGYYLVFISKGKGVLQTARTSPETLQEGSCFFLFPGVWHRYKPEAKTGWEEYWIGFKGNYPERLLKQSFFRREQPTILLTTPLSLLKLFQQVIDIVRKAEEGYNQVLSGLVLQMLGILRSNQLVGSSPDSVDRIVSRAKFLLQEAIDQPVKMESLVQELSVSYSTFRKRFKEQTGVSPNQYLLNLRLNKAKELLLSTHLSVYEIAGQTGFDSIHYFSKHFKQKHKLSPVAYRKRQRPAL